MLSVTGKEASCCCETLSPRERQYSQTMTEGAEAVFWSGVSIRLVKGAFETPLASSQSRESENR